MQDDLGGTKDCVGMMWQRAMAAARSIDKKFMVVSRRFCGWGLGFGIRFGI
jgi:hypothetical protein